MKTRSMSIAIISALSLFLLAGCAEGSSHQGTAVSEASTSSVSHVTAKKAASSKKQAPALTVRKQAASEQTNDAAVAASSDNQENQTVANQSQVAATSSTPSSTTSQKAPATAAAQSQQPAAQQSSASQGSNQTSAATSSSRPAAQPDNNTSTPSAVPVAAFYGKWIGPDGFMLYYTTAGEMVVTQQGNTTKSPVVAEPMPDGRILFRATQPGINNILAKVIDGRMYLTMVGYDSLALTRDTTWDGQLPE